VDLLDGSPVLDVKPYLPYADAVRGATTGWAREPIARAPVRFTRKASAQVRHFESTRPELRALIRGLLSLDPRPAFQQRRMPLTSPAAEGTRWGFSVVDLEVRWEVRAGGIQVVEVFVPDDARYIGGTG
jgi:tRNA (adenine37-N6)-methyltransferase